MKLSRDVLKGLAVEFIRLLWQYGYYRNNKWLKEIHDNWFQYWVEFKAQETMNDVDRQIEQLREPSTVDPPIYTEQKEGPTALGGEMRLTAPWTISDSKESSKLKE